MALTRRQFGTAVTTAALAGAYGRPGWAQAPLVIKFSHVVANDTPKGKGSLKFKELAEQATGGKVKIEVYPNSTLYKDKEEIEALQLGAVQLLAPSTAKFAPLGVKEFEALDLPFLFSSDDQYNTIMKGEVGKYLFQKLDAKGIAGLGFWDNGFHMLTANKPIKKPADLQGLKIRISGSKVADQYFRKLGAIPQILAFSEVYQAMQTGVVDGGENTPSNVLTQKFYEVQKYITIGRHAHLQYAVISSSKFWGGLPADFKGPLDKAIVEANDFTNGIARQENIDALADMKKMGRNEFYELNDAERKEWREAMLPTYAWAEGRVGKEVIGILQEATANG